VEWAKLKKAQPEGVGVGAERRRNQQPIFDFCVEKGCPGLVRWNFTVVAMPIFDWRRRRVTIENQGLKFQISNLRFSRLWEALGASDQFSIFVWKKDAPGLSGGTSPWLLCRFSIGDGYAKKTPRHKELIGSRQDAEAQRFRVVAWRLGGLAGEKSFVPLCLGGQNPQNRKSKIENQKSFVGLIVPAWR
jgi:hypothetical protein